MTVAMRGSQIAACHKTEVRERYTVDINKATNTDYTIEHHTTEESRHSMNRLSDSIYNPTFRKLIY